MELLIPGAKKITLPSTNIAKTSSSKKITPIPTPTPHTRPTTIDDDGIKSQYTIKYTGKSRGFAAGNCTWFVAQNKTVTWR
jgi:surface antigen